MLGHHRCPKAIAVAPAKLSSSPPSRISLPTVGGDFVSLPEPDSVWREQESGAIRRNLTGIPEKKSCDSG
jgi:hypothetical protein